MYPAYKLIRAINRQYPNNGFINAVDVTENTFDGIIPEDFRDILNECIRDVYQDIAIDEIYSFPTVPGQREYELPLDCDLRDIQEVVRKGMPPPPPVFHGPTPEQKTFAIMFDANGGLGSMEPIVVDAGNQFVLPANPFIAPDGYEFGGWLLGGEVYEPGYGITVTQDVILSAYWAKIAGVYTLTLRNITNSANYFDIEFKTLGGPAVIRALYYDQPITFQTGTDGTLGSTYEYIRASYGGISVAQMDMEYVFTQDEVRDLYYSMEPEPGHDGPVLPWEDNSFDIDTDEEDNPNPGHDPITPPWETPDNPDAPVEPEEPGDDPNPGHDDPVLPF